MTNLPEMLARNLKIPGVAAPMFLISGPDMVIASSRAGMIGSFPTPNARTIQDLEDWLLKISTALGPESQAACWAANLIVHPSNDRLSADLDLIVKYRVPLVITALGSPMRVLEKVKAYGGLLFADVNSVSFARKAVSAGVDGLILVASGAGGHTGQMAGFAFVEEVRQFFDGPIILGGAISTGRAIRAAEILGADLAYLGTSLIASDESLANPGYKEMVVASSAEDIVPSKAITGVMANWLKTSLVNAGYDPAALPEDKKPDFANAQDDAKAWKNIWSAGQGVGAVRDQSSMEKIVERLVLEYTEASRLPVFSPQE